MGVTNHKYDPARDKNTWQFNDGALVTIPLEHARVHNANMFRAGYFWTSVDNNGTAEVLFACGASAAHMSIQAAVGGDFYGTIYEGTTVTGASGTAMTGFCMNRMSPRTGLTKVYHGPEGISVTGTPIAPTQYIVGGGGPQSQGGGGRTNAEWIFSAGGNYLVRMVNKAGASKSLNIIAEWYETSD